MVVKKVRPPWPPIARSIFPRKMRDLMANHCRSPEASSECVVVFMYRNAIRLFGLLVPGNRPGYIWISAFDI